MIRRATDRLVLLLMVVQFCSMICSADEQPAPGTVVARPDLVNCAIGNVTFQIDGLKLWTLSGFEYKAHSIATRDSAYGTVLNIEGVGLLGSAHFLDVPGQPGKVEKEDVTRLEFFVDGSRVATDFPQAKLNGKSFRLMRASTIRSVRIESEVSVENDVLIETVHLQNQQDVRLKLSYPLMYAWSPNMTDHLFGDDTGVIKRGSFRANGSTTGEGLERTARWMAVYDSGNCCGAVCLLLQRPESEEVWFQYTDAPGVYRKLRLMSFSEKTLPAGFDGTYQSAVGFFTAEPFAWEAAAISRLLELRRLEKTEP
jgi:hypothetical protein